MHAANCIRRPSTVLSSLVLVFVTTGALRAEAATPAAPASKVDFERHLMGLFGKLGCNAGACHGSFQGKGGLRLSLFGYAPERDFMALTREAMGRRINPVRPEISLLLLKGAGLTDHAGGRRFAKDSWQYRMFRDWIAAGAVWKPGTGTVKSIAIEPAELAFARRGDSRQLKVRATFANDDVEDITAFCDFRINDDAIGSVDSTGLVSSKQPGDTAVVVSYRGNVMPVRVLVPVDAAKGFVYPKVAEHNYIDKQVYAKLKRLNIVPSGQADDAEFLRRVYVDTIASLPTPDEVRSFLADKDPNKRAKKIDELLAHPLHAALWATKFCDITGNNTDLLEQPREKRSKMWYDWLRKRMQDNTPYDQLVHGILCATSRDGKEPAKWIDEVKAVEDQARKSFDTSYADRASLDLFWRRQNANVPLEQWGEKTAAAFLGIRLECAQCHKHPFDRWTQHDYRAYANIFGQVSYSVSPESKKAIDEENRERRKVKDKKNQLPALKEVFASTRLRALSDPDTEGKLTPRALGGPAIEIKEGEDARAALFRWMVQPDNPFFARSFVNRVWGHYLGVGIVEPIDDFSLANPPSNPQLLDALARDFVEHKFDIRHIERAILNSRVYQQTSTPNDTNKLDGTNYSHSLVRRMMAEVVLDVLNGALEVQENWGNSAPAGARAIEVAASRVQNANLEYALKIFGRSARTAACDCERSLEPALPQTLFMMTDSGVLQKLNSGRLNNLLKSGKNDDEILEELVLATLSRLPTAQEKKTFADYKATVKDRKTLFVDTLWALINTREFILNH